MAGYATDRCSYTIDNRKFIYSKTEVNLCRKTSHGCTLVLSKSQAVSSYNLQTVICFYLFCFWFAILKGVQKGVEEARVEWEKKYALASTEDTERAVEFALSQARADWLKHEEELRQREIDQAVEVAITNALAEARHKWEKEAQMKVMD